MKLEQDPVNNVDLIVAKQKPENRVLYESDQALMILDLKMDCLFVVCEEEKELADLLAARPKAPVSMAVFHQKQLLSVFSDFTGMMEVVNVVYPRSTITWKTPEEIVIRALQNEDVLAAAALYPAGSKEYIRSRIEKQALFGAFAKDRLAGIIGTHEEGSIGLLSVDPYFRRRHLATALESFMIEQQLGRGAIPFAQVVTDNTASLALQRKLGMRIGDRPIVWAETK